ncbi:response regulator [Solilutibacter tolerans]|uniref:Hpt domain-containing protein n=1 Tax=Solilutibacter tolerans TaxID=1604334 RepID=A0A1N6VJI1_9GAMM|nr:response regulator [Lysobacter tolerans]SIQ78042.1 Hpt domain-containing protein [Lysobacter tolerans]
MRDSGMNPRLLLVEDDPVSLAYLGEAARALPAEVDCAANLAEAFALASRHRYDAWLIDANLPDGSGAELLSRLRETLASPPPRALAHTASQLPEELAALRALGFDDVVSKPLPVDAWQQAIRQCLGDSGQTSTWDDDGALRALNGNVEAVASLRALFIAELPRQSLAIHAALDAGDADAARAELHKLKASCGFVGAGRIRRAVDDLHANVSDMDALAHFDEAVGHTLDPARAKA